MKLSNRVFLIGGSIVMSLVARGLAVDRYVVEVPPFAMAGDPELLVKVTGFSGGEVDPTPHAIKFVGLPAGVRVDPLVPASSLTVSGPTEFRLSIDPAVTARRVFIRVQKSGSAKVTGGGFVNVERTVAKFILLPAGMSAPRAGVPFRFQVTATDDVGAIVASYKDPVDLKVDVGAVQESVISGEQFKKGVAFVELTFSEPSPVERPLRLEAAARVLYTGQAERAAGTMDLAVLPKGSGR